MSGGENKKACLGSGYVPSIGYIEEILINILLKLPVPSVVNFRLVAKHWLRLIGETQFAQLHFNSYPKITKYILHLDESYYGKTLYTVDVDRNRTIMPYAIIPSLFRKSSLISSFNGLLCFTNPDKSSDIKIQICNPATLEVLELPDGSPSTKTPSIGVVFDPDRNRFKILRFFRDASEDISYQCEIYTPGVGHWRGIGVVEPPVPNPFCHYFPTHVSVGGRMYWLVWSEDQNNIPDYILSVDMDENFIRIELPLVEELEGNPVEPEGNPVESDDSSYESDDSSDELNGFTFLIQYGGGLGLVSVNNSEIGVNVWSLVGSVWTREWYAQLDINGNANGINSIVSIGQELLFVMDLGFGGPHLFQLLNLAEETWRNLILFRECAYQPRQPVVFPFVESLFRCDGSN